MPNSTSIVAANFERVRQKMAAAAGRSGRTLDDVTLVAVTKYASLDAIRDLVAIGCRDLGESRPQQLQERAAALANPALRWHLIGHLQRNKVRRTIPVTHLIHSADSLRLVEACGAESVALGRPTRLLLEVNVSGDPAKHGFLPAEFGDLIDPLCRVVGVELRGLMAMAGINSDATQTRREFAAVRELRDRLQPRCPPHIQLRELSLGMSGDFELAIEEGATLVRVGSALFEGLET